MAEIKKITIACTGCYLNIINNLYEDKNFREESGNNVFFFRGHVNSNFKLLPNVFRERIDKEYERRILLNYRDHLPRSVHNTRFDFVKDRIEILAEMQHYGIPTRLLDWTMSPLIALYFAVRRQDSISHKNENSCVWVYNPWRHQKMLRGQGKFDGWFNMMKLGRALLSDREPPQIARDLQAIFNISDRLCDCELEEPIGLIAPYQNNRMIHQASAFTIHGTKPDPLEDMIDNKFLKKLVIPKEARDDILKELNRLFINEYTVFPDFVGMSNEIKDKGSLYHYSISSQGETLE